MIKSVKGLDVLLEAMPKIVKSNPNILLLVAGKPWKDDFSKYENQISRLNIKKFGICMWDPLQTLVYTAHNPCVD